MSYTNQYNAIAGRQVDWVIVRGDRNVSDDYKLVLSASSPYDCSTSSGQAYSYKLYQLERRNGQQLPEDEDTSKAEADRLSW